MQPNNNLTPEKLNAKESHLHEISDWGKFLDELKLYTQEIVRDEFTRCLIVLLQVILVLIIVICIFKMSMLDF